MLILPTGGKGTGVEASGSNFPFVQPSGDIVGLLADLWLSHDRQEVVPPLRVTQLTGFQQAFEGQPSAAQITIVDSKNTTIFDSPGAAYHYKPWGRLWIHEWLFSNAVCRVVQHCAVPEPRVSWPSEIVPINGVLDERTSEVWPERLLFLSDSSGTTVQGSIQFNNGYNVDITTTPYAESLRNSTLLTFKADPGGGPGSFSRLPGHEIFPSLGSTVRVPIRTATSALLPASATMSGSRSMSGMTGWPYRFRPHWRWVMTAIRAATATPSSMSRKRS